MNSVPAQLCVDLGNSETRILVLYQAGDVRTMKAEYKTLTNSFSNLKQVPVFEAPITSQNSAIFKPHGVFKSPSGDSHAQGIYAHGDIVKHEYGGGDLRPTAIIAKHKALASLLSWNVIFLRAAEMLSNITGIPLQDLEPEWEIYTLLPPGSIGDPRSDNSGSGQMSELIRSIRRIEFSNPEISMDVKISGKITVIPESVSAYLGALLTMDQSAYRPKSRSLTESKTLILDIGAGTTDLAVMNGTAPVRSSFTTINLGGNNVKAKLASLFSGASNGFALNEDNRNLAALEGKVRSNGREIDVTEFLDQARHDVARDMASKVIAFLETITDEIQGIEKLILVGGGSMLGGSEGVQAIGKMLVDELSYVFSGIELADLPYGELDTSGGANVTVTPRTLNVIGAGSYAVRAARVARTAQ